LHPTRAHHESANLVFLQVNRQLELFKLSAALDAR
jgi:hypothetical protein